MAALPPRGSEIVPSRALQFSRTPPAETNKLLTSTLRPPVQLIFRLLGTRETQHSHERSVTTCSLEFTTLHKVDCGWGSTKALSSPQGRKSPHQFVPQGLTGMQLPGWTGANKLKLVMQVKGCVWVTMFPESPSFRCLDYSA